MAEDREELFSQGPDPEPSAAPPGRASRINRGQQRRRQRSVFQYITILFAAALVLLFYTFMMERRQYEQRQEENQANISDLQQESVSAVQRLQGMMEENETLKAQVAQLEHQLAEEKASRADLEARWNELAEEKSSLEETFDWTVRAMDLFWQIDEAYTRGRTMLCRELIAQMENPETEPAAGLLRDYLPTENTSGTGRFSPYDRYQEIREKVIK